MPTTKARPRSKKLDPRPVVDPPPAEDGVRPVAEAATRAAVARFLEERKRLPSVSEVLSGVRAASHEATLWSNTSWRPMFNVERELASALVAWQVVDGREAFDSVDCVHAELNPRIFRPAAVACGGSLYVVIPDDGGGAVVATIARADVVDLDS